MAGRTPGRVPLSQGKCMKHVSYSALALFVVGAPSALGVASFGPSTYITQLDSPLVPASFTWFHLEDFEDGALNTPGVSVNGGFVLNPGPLTDSIDAGGRTFYAGGGGRTTLTFTFNAAALGGTLPTHAGIVWTDVGYLLGGGLGGPSNVIFEAFDASNVSLGTIGPVSLGDAAFDGGQGEDRFFGMESAGGISRISITMPDSDDWEVDHLQYGNVPGPGALSVLGCTLVVTRRTRRPAIRK